MERGTSSHATSPATRILPPSNTAGFGAQSSSSPTDQDARGQEDGYGDFAQESAYSRGQKDELSSDWYIEGPGRRVGYDDLTAIDWIYEYTKERQRLRRLLALNPGLSGQLRQLFDASHVWLVLVASGISVGCVAALINIASDWLGDIKTGYCKKGTGGGQFYLNKQFCCWGHDDFSQCQDWTPWPSALGVGPVGGQYVISYIFFIVFAVCSTSLCLRLRLTIYENRFFLLSLLPYSSSTTRYTPDIVASRK